MTRSENVFQQEASLALSSGRECEPCCQGGALLVLLPGRADQLPEFGDATLELIDGDGQCCGSLRVHLALAHSRVGQVAPLAGVRSEEHTSELQSHVNLVCRLLLE